MIDSKQNDSAPVTKGRIRMAYSFAGTQPVLCTLLCDQPLYYMEDELFDEDEGSLFLEEEQMINAALSSDLGPIQKKISIYDGVAKKFEAAPDARARDFIDNAQSFGFAASLDLDNVMQTFAQSRYAQSLLDQAQVHAALIVMSDQVRGADYDAQANLVLINPHQTTGDAVLGLARALRLLVQAHNGAGAHPLTYHPDEAILVNRAQAADIAVTQVRVAWELQLASVNAPWARLEQTQGSDLARAFAREALCDFRSLSNGKAARVAFENWFLSDRCKIADRELIQAMLADQEARHFELAHNQVGPIFFAALGEQTLGKNYLAEMSGALMSDPLFSDVRDRSNANFLWFVKFERSFKETEKDVAKAERETIHSFEITQKPESFAELSRKYDTKSVGSDHSMADADDDMIVAGLENHMNQSNIVYVSFGGLR